MHPLMNSHGRCPNLWAYIRLNEPSSESIKDLCAQSRSLFSTSRCLRLLQLLSTLNLEFSPAWGGGGWGGDRSPWPRVEGAETNRRAAVSLDSLLLACGLYPRGQAGSKAFFY